MSEVMELETTTGDLEDEGGAPLTAVVAEQTLIGMLLLHPEIAADIRDLVTSREFFDRALGRAFDCIVAAGGFKPDNNFLLEQMGATIEIAGRTGDQLIGYLISLAFEKPVEQASALAQTIFEVAERRFTEEGQTNLVGLDAWQSKMGLLLYADRNSPASDEYDYLVEDLIPEQELVIVMGETQTGKSFITGHLGLCIAQGKAFFGRRVLNPRPVIWCAYEGGRGARARMLAYERHFGVQSEVPFAALTQPFDLWSNEKHVDDLIREVEGICRIEFAGQTPGAVIIDTHNAATPGASEIDSEVVSKIRDRYKRLIRALKTTIIIIGHTNALGKHRGNEQLTNNVETILRVTYKTRLENREKIQIKDNDGRDVRTLHIQKQREGETGKEFDFVLHGVGTGLKNKFGKERMSCVVTEPNWTPGEEQAAKAGTKPKDSKTLGQIQTAYFKAFWTALQEEGEAAPPELGLPRTVKVVRTALVNRMFNSRFIPTDMSPNTAKARRQRAETYFTNKEIIRIDNDRKIAWWTGRYHPDLKDTHSARPSRFDDMNESTSAPEPDFPE